LEFRFGTDVDSAHNLAGTDRVLLSGDSAGFQLRQIFPPNFTKNTVDNEIKINDVKILSVQGLATDPTTGLLWAMATDNSVFADPFLGLITINPFTGEGRPDLNEDSVIGSADERFVSISFDKAGNLWGVTDIGATLPNQNTLWQFDKDTGIPTAKCKLNDGLVAADITVIPFFPFQIPKGQEKAIGFNPNEPNILYHTTGFSSPIFETIDLLNFTGDSTDPCDTDSITPFEPLGPARAITFSESLDKFLYVLGGETVIADPTDVNSVFELATDGTISASTGKLLHSSQGIAFKTNHIQ